ncbi:MAG: Fic family protein [Synergistaceae bacterium]|nr:Fic family protein [Synergistaceae bacterium]
MTVSNRAGYYRRNLSGAAEYKSFVPSRLPLDSKLKIDDEMIEELARAHHNIGVLEGKSSQIPNVHLFVAMYVRKEALMSSQIEGTQATLEDVLDPTIDVNANRDVEDVVNYVSAIDAAVEMLDKLPICSRLLCYAHKILLSRTRGSDKQPGEYRHSQNWVGSSTSTINTARYVPPNVDDMKEAISNLEKYVNAEEDEVDVLIKAGLIHYQFETIHPFLDGNGRIGRLLIVLYLMSKGLLSTPALYVSYYLKANRLEYYDRLEAVRKSGDYEQWIKFFLRAISESADNAAVTIDRLSRLRERVTEEIQSLGRSAKRGMKLLKYLEEHPLLERAGAARELGMSFNTVSLAVKDMVRLGILHSDDSRKRRKMYYYREYLEILRAGT